jgi:hypothetical protein
MAIILPFSDTVSLKSVMICCTTAATFNFSLLVELGACTDRPVQQMLHGRLQASSKCLRCQRLTVLRVLTQCSCIEN